MTNRNMETELWRRQLTEMNHKDSPGTRVGMGNAVARMAFRVEAEELAFIEAEELDFYSFPMTSH